jgi:predicted O-linked N-acetylglucosamine transferase (SPINDLY family)
MDYRLTDPYLDPERGCNAWHSEESVRLPNSFWCYDPLARHAAPNELPALQNGHITFGCLNNFCKVNDQVLDLWSSIMRQIKGSRVMILADSGRHRERTFSVFEKKGIDRTRVEFADRRSRPDYMKLFHKVDLVLDTFPYNGHTTGLDALWMGVAFVTLAGRHAVSRAGVSLLENIGMPEMIASSPERYAQLAVELSQNLPRLSELRKVLRGRMRSSPLMDGGKFARDVEQAYRMMWRRWCVSEPLKQPDP